MFIRPTGEGTEVTRSDALTHALEALKKTIPPRMVNTWIAITRGSQTWRERADELRVSPGAIGYHLKRVDREIKRLFREETS